MTSSLHEKLFLLSMYIYQKMHLIKYIWLQILKLIHVSAPKCHSQKSYKTEKYKTNMFVDIKLENSKQAKAV